MNVQSDPVVWQQMSAWVTIVSCAAILVLTIATAWRIGLSSRAPQAGLDISGGHTPAVIAALGALTGVVLSLTVPENEFAFAAGILAAVGACAAAWVYLLTTRDRAGAIHDALLNARISAAGHYGSAPGFGGDPHHW